MPEHDATDISPGELDAYVRQAFCDCGGTFEDVLRQRTVEPSHELDDVFEIVTMSCSQCGNEANQRFHLVWSVNVDSSDAPLDAHRAVAPEALANRRQHDLFVQRVLPELFFARRDQLIEMFAGADRNDRIRALWDITAGDALELGQPVRLPSDGLRIQRVRLGDRPSLIVELPAPRNRAEAYFVMLVGGGAPRYLVLEDAEPCRAGVPRAVLCEWIADGSRHHHQRHIVPDRDTFIALVADVLQRESD